MHPIVYCCVFPLFIASLAGCAAFDGIESIGSIDDPTGAQSGVYGGSLSRVAKAVGDARASCDRPAPAATVGAFTFGTTNTFSGSQDISVRLGPDAGACAVASSSDGIISQVSTECGGGPPGYTWLDGGLESVSGGLAISITFEWMNPEGTCEVVDTWTLTSGN